MTSDIDIFFDPTVANAKRLRKALDEVGFAGVEEIPIKTVLTKKILMRQFALQADAHPFVKGARFKDAWKSRVPAEIQGVTVYVPSLETMISMKKSAGRKKDKEDLAFLKRIQKKMLKREH